MTEEILDKNWKMKSLTDREFLETTVPGSVYQTYLAHGKMEDPFYRDNEEKALELMLSLIHISSAPRPVYSRFTSGFPRPIR